MRRPPVAKKKARELWIVWDIGGIHPHRKFSWYMTREAAQSTANACGVKTSLVREVQPRRKRKGKQ